VQSIFEKFLFSFLNLVVAAAAETNCRLLGALQLFYKIFSVLLSRVLAADETNCRL
jgi:hypothetical protein